MIFRLAANVLLFALLPYEVMSLTLDSMVQYLRGEDERLIRYNVPDDAARMRQEDVCKEEDLKPIMNLVHEIASSNEKLVKNESIRNLENALQVITLCATNNNLIRSFVGEYRQGEIIRTIVSLIQLPMLHSADQTLSSELIETYLRVSAHASESLWILSFNSINHDIFVDGGAIEALSQVIVSNMETTGINFAKMWALAALQNIAASYCESHSGHCRWFFDEESKTVRLDDEASLKINGHRSRSQILNDHLLLASLRRLVCREPSPTFGPHSDDNPWPAHAKIGHQHENHPNIVTWAAAGIVRNLILLQESWSEVVPMYHCLCALMFSDDWLESEKSKDALFRMGLSDQCIPPWYNGCQDVRVVVAYNKSRQWINGFNETCEMYAENNWCGEYGHLSDGNGFSANQACCVCGGGDRSSKSEEL